MKTKLYEVTYKVTPTSETQTRELYQYQNISIESMTSILKYESDITKNELVVVSLKKLN